MLKKMLNIFKSLSAFEAEALILFPYDFVKCNILEVGVLDALQSLCLDLWMIFFKETFIGIEQS